MAGLSWVRNYGGLALRRVFVLRILQTHVLTSLECWPGQKFLIQRIRLKNEQQLQLGLLKIISMMTFRVCLKTGLEKSASFRRWIFS